jgi:hypothetical protein
VCCRGGFLSETPSGRREEEEKEIKCLSVSEEYFAGNEEEPPGNVSGKGKVTWLERNS